MKTNLFTILVLAVGLMAALTIGVARAEVSASSSATSGDTSSSAMSSSDQGTTSSSNSEMRTDKDATSSDSTMSSRQDDTSTTDMEAQDDNVDKRGYGSVQSGTGGSMEPGDSGGTAGPSPGTIK